MADEDGITPTESDTRFLWFAVPLSAFVGGLCCFRPS
jgi:hypothetical protein